MKSVPALSILFIFTTLVLSTGCGTNSLITAGGAGAGAYIGHSASNKNPYWTAGGAAGGVLVGSLLNHKLQQQLQQAEQRGFERALNQSARQHYWMLQNLQKNSEDTDTVGSYSYILIIRPETTVDGVSFNETREHILVYE
jgi:hypothetical protein